MNPLLSICITSYNRVIELKRSLNSIKVKKENINKIEVVVSEDSSPNKLQIEELVYSFSKNTEYNVIFNSNQINLGYDKNLKQLQFLAKGAYIFYLSDDDIIYEDYLDKLISMIETSKKKYEMIFGPFIYRPKNELRRKYNNSFYIEKGQKNAVKYLYDSILFSGLIFKKATIIGLEAEKFLNTNYFQVYVFLYVIYNFGAYYYNEISIDSISDGENAYGNVDSVILNNTDLNLKLLSDRNSIFSNLEFHKGLSKVISIFDGIYDTKVFFGFSKEYSLRSYNSLKNARLQGLNVFLNYWKSMRMLNIKISIIAYIYFLILLIFNVKVSNILISLPKKILLLNRENRGG